MERAAFVGTEDALTERIIAVFYEVYNELGYGFVESIYGKAMGIALSQSGWRWLRRLPSPFRFVVS